MQRALSPKKLAFRALLAALGPSRRMRDLLSFYPHLSGLPDRLESVADRRDYRIRLAEPRFAAALAALAPFDSDVRRPQVALQDDFVSRIFCGIVNDVEVTGHTLTPVDRVTGIQVAFGFEGLTNWNFARPGLGRVRRRRIGDVAVVVPPHRNYWHVLLEHLVPLAHAWRLRAWGDRPLTILTGRSRPALVDAFVAGLRADGAAVRIDEPSPFEHLAVESLLIAVNHSSNTERSPALAGAVPVARRLFERAYAGRPGTPSGPRIFLTREGSRLRELATEDAVWRLLERRGFRRFKADWGNHPDQIAAFAGAELVVGAHGAGLANVVFARPGATLVELIPSDYRKSTMLHLCAEHDLRHVACFGTRMGPRQAFSIDPEAVAAAVDSVLEGGPAAAPTG